MSEALCLGELLIDLVSTLPGASLADSPGFTRAPGGAPANVAVALSRLGVGSGFMGKVGDDPFGHFLVKTLIDEGVDISALRLSKDARTALAFISLEKNGHPDFMFYRNPSADMLFNRDEVDATAIEEAQVFHFGSITLIADPVRSATLRALRIARNAGCFITYDPNLRLSLWPSESEAKAGIRMGFPYADVIKLSSSEIAFLGRRGEPEFDSVRELWHPNLKLMVITDSAKGCRYYHLDHQGAVDGFDVEAVDSTGAGDGFMAGLISRLLPDRSILDDPARLEPALRYANAVGALTTTQHGAIPALPTPEQVGALFPEC